MAGAARSSEQKKAGEKVFSPDPSSISVSSPSKTKGVRGKRLPPTFLALPVARIGARGVRARRPVIGPLRRGTRRVRPRAVRLCGIGARGVGAHGAIQRPLRRRAGRVVAGAVSARLRRVGGAVIGPLQSGARRVAAGPVAGAVAGGERRQHRGSSQAAQQGGDVHERRTPRYVADLRLGWSFRIARGGGQGSVPGLGGGPRPAARLLL